MIATLDFDNACPQAAVPMQDEFQRWIECAQQQADVATKPVNIGIRIVDEIESAQLNRDYRGKDYATNVLSFNSDLPESLLNELDEIPLGDLAICAPVVQREAVEQGKTLNAHWTHMVVHGVLHLNGFDHENDDDAERMEALEKAILATLGIADPYLDIAVQQ
ncbi:MAG: rRNA maturation RNase YbeY [Gammaproteobacteria bacterium]|nr:rRNA maturation RNase YbeY [Gammaproteobacteria bacterium]MDP2141917.1 rRNA maturation RNase YbeY [Gammaproteobacteria bacterium]MDP2347201.1 rRNA maturation RNase YbeY [Gammaproteobacteria bacterium]